MKRALKKQEAHKNMEKHLQTIKETINRLDPHAKVYLFGSVAENRHTYSSDIDVLITTEMDPAKVNLELWKSGVKEPFEIHVQPPDKLEFYSRRAKLVKK